MRLISAYVDNFGCLSDKEFVFENGLNTVVLPNGSGKSTLAAFIKAMFYGLPSARKNGAFNDRTHYFPFSGKSFGGRIRFSEDGKEYEISRYFDARQADDFTVTENGIVTERFGTNLGLSLFGIDGEAFMRCIFMSPENEEIRTNDTVIAKLNNLVTNDDSKLTDDAENALKAEINAIDGERLNDTKLLPLALKKRFEAEEAEKKAALLDKKLKELYTDKQLITDNINELLNRFESKEKKLAWRTYDDYCFRIEANKKICSEVLEKYRNDVPKTKGKNEAKTNYIAVAVLFFAVAIILSVAGVMLFENLLKFIFLASAAFMMVLSAVFVIFSIVQNKITARNEETENDRKELASTYKKLLKENEILAKEAEKFKEENNLNENFRDNQEVDVESVGELIKQENDELLTIDSAIMKLNSEIIELRKTAAQKEDAIYEAGALSDRLFAVRKALEYIEKSRNNLKERYVYPVRDRLNMYLSSVEVLTNKKFTVDRDMCIYFENNGKLRDEKYLSTGEKAVISAFMRISLCDNLFSAEKPFMIFDDVFMSLDKDAFAKAGEVLKRLSCDRQIIYFTCSEDRRL